MCDKVHFLRRGQQVVSFHKHDTGMVTVDEGEAMPFTVTMEEAKTEWVSRLDDGWMKPDDADLAELHRKFHKDQQKSQQEQREVKLEAKGIAELAEQYEDALHDEDTESEEELPDGDQEHPSVVESAGMCVTTPRELFRLTNSRTGESVEIDLDRNELATEFAKVARGDHFVWYWMAKQVLQERERRATLAASGVKNDKTSEMTEFISDLFLIAIGKGLKRPMIRLTDKELARRYKIYLSRRGTVCIKGGDVNPGTGDPVGNEEYIGCLIGDKFLPGSGENQFGTTRREPKPIAPKDQQFLDRMGKDPVGYFAKCSRDMDRCCYCNKPLEDERSKEVGYGRVCAGHWGLPWGKKGRTEEVPSFAELWAKARTDDKADIRGICREIRKEPNEQLHWNVLRDKLEESGWPEDRLPNKPTKIVLMPRA